MSEAAASRIAGARQPFWVFGYGSLMWNPGFPYGESRPALLEGYHRAFCIYSHHYRGTPERPGLVLGLDRGGSCRGIAFQVGEADVEAVRAYLDERELVNYAYRSAHLTVRLDGAATAALTYVADPLHPQYAGRLDPDTAADIIVGAQGCAGLNRDYLIRTVRRLEEEGFVDPDLHDLLERVWARTGQLEAGGGI